MSNRVVEKKTSEWTTPTGYKIFRFSALLTFYLNCTCNSVVFSSPVIFFFIIKAVWRKYTILLMYFRKLRSLLTGLQKKQFFKKNK